MTSQTEEHNQDIKQTDGQEKEEFLKGGTIEYLFTGGFETQM